MQQRQRCITGTSHGLSAALIKIAYGLAARGDAVSSMGCEKEKQAEAERSRRIDAIGAMNIFDRGNAVSLVMSSAATMDTRPNVELIKGAMQWDLWNPWALYYELHSTHPLTAKRLQALGDQAASHGQEPLVTFDRAKPESYWDEFLIDLALMWAPSLAFLGGLAIFVVQLIITESLRSVIWLGLGIMLSGLLSLICLRFSYRGGPFENLTVAALLHRVKVSAIRPVPITLRGTIIGKGVPGLIWSEDFVLRDNTGLIFLDCRQPLAISQWLFGLFRAGQYQGKEVQITGWYRRSPVSFVELKHLQV